MIADDRDAETARPQQVGRPVAVDADQIRHDIRRAALAAIDQQRHARRRALRRRRLRHDDVGRVIAGADFGDLAELEPVLLQPQLRRPLGFAEQRRHDGRARSGAAPTP